MQDETAIVIELNSTGVICDNRFEGGGPWFGIRVVAGSRALVARNEFKHLDHAILLENQGGASEALVTGNHFLRVAVGLNVAGGCTATFTGNALDAEGDGSTRGVVSEGSATVAGNVFRRIEIALLLDGANATVTGNTFDQCGAGGIDAVHINTAPAVVSGNAFFGSTAADISSPGDVSIFSANGVSVSLVGDEAVEVSPKLQTGMLEADTVGVATSGAPALVPLHVSGKAMFGDAFSPTTSHTQAALNLLAGQGATAPANGIKFYEFGTGDFGMSLGYDGTATGVNNALRIYDNGGDPVLSFENGGHVGLGVTNPTNPIEHSSGATLTVGGTWSDASSVTLKENFRPVDPDGVLGRLAALPVTRWSYKAEPGIDHIGPMAEDFHAAFGLGPDDRTISGTDRSGVAFAAIKALHEKLEAKERRVQELERRLEAIERKLEPAR